MKQDAIWRRDQGINLPVWANLGILIPGIPARPFHQGTRPLEDTQERTPALGIALAPLLLPSFVHALTLLTSPSEVQGAIAEVRGQDRVTDNSTRS